MLHNDTSWLKCTQMTLAIGMLRSVSLLHYHLTHPNVLLKCHDVDFFLLKEVNYVDEWNPSGN